MKNIKKKIKGTSAERELLKLFWDNHWVCIRVAGSGSSSYPSPDLIAGNGFKRVVIEVKYVNDLKKYFTKKEIDDLIYFANNFGAESWIAIKFQNIDWYFLTTSELELKEKSYFIDIFIAKKKGLTVDEFFKLN